MESLPTQSPYETTEDFQDRLYPFIHGRHRDGTFAVGNPGGPGRPKKIPRPFGEYKLHEPASNPEVEALIEKAIASGITSMRKLNRLLRNT